jgi:hypothetical protein
MHTCQRKYCPDDTSNIEIWETFETMPKKGVWILVFLEGLRCRAFVLRRIHYLNLFYK